METLGCPWLIFIKVKFGSKTMVHCGIKYGASCTSVNIKGQHSVTIWRNLVVLRSLWLNVCQHFQKTSHLKHLDQFQSNFICSILTIWGSEICSNGHDHMINMASIPIDGKNLDTSRGLIYIMGLTLRITSPMTFCLWLVLHKVTLFLLSSLKSGRNFHDWLKR